MSGNSRNALIGGGVLVAGVGLGIYITSRHIENHVLKTLTPYNLQCRYLVSVIIPALNEENYLPVLLSSIARQTYQPIEVIVADSSSLDSKKKTEKICNDYHAIYTNVPKLNVSLARNEGARASTGKILLFCDADTILAYDYVEKLVKGLTDGHILAHGVDPSKGGIHSFLTTFSRVIVKPRCFTTGRGIAIWRDVFFRIGGYDESMDPMEGFREDLDLGRRVVGRYGEQSITLNRSAYILTSARREKVFGYRMWTIRGVRDTIREW